MLDRPLAISSPEPHRKMVARLEEKHPVESAKVVDPA